MKQNRSTKRTVLNVPFLEYSSKFCHTPSNVHVWLTRGATHSTKHSADWRIPTYTGDRVPRELIWKWSAFKYLLKW